VVDRTAHRRHRGDLHARCRGAASPGRARNLGRQSPQVQQRQATPPAQPPQQATPAQPGAQQAAPTKAPAAGAPGAAARPPVRARCPDGAGGRTWGLPRWRPGSASGEALTLFLTIMLVGLALMMLVGFVMRRMRGPAAGRRGTGCRAWTGYVLARRLRDRARHPCSSARAWAASAGGRAARLGDGPVLPAVKSHRPGAFPPDSTTAQFLAHAKDNFARLQTALDTSNLDEIADFTTNEMFHRADARVARARRPDEDRGCFRSTPNCSAIESNADEHVASVKFDGTLRVDGEIERVPKCGTW